MTLGELPTGGLYIDLGLGIVVFLLLLYEIAAQARTRKRLTAAREKYCHSTEQSSGGVHKPGRQGQRSDGNAF